MESFTYYDLGRIDYPEALKQQTNAFNVLLASKANNTQEKSCLFFCEHNPVMTLGKSGHESNLLIPEDLLQNRGIAFFHINRGGDITYHE